jgi:hypothetical protein
MRDSFAAYRAALAARLHRTAFASHESRTAAARVVFWIARWSGRGRSLLIAGQRFEHLAGEERDLAEAKRICQVDSLLAEAKFAPLAEQHGTVLAAEVAHNHPILTDDQNLGVDAAH